MTITNYKKTIEAIYKDFDKGDIQAVINLCDPAVVWTSYGPAEYPEDSTFIGHEGVQRFFTVDSQTFSLTSFNPGPYVCEGNRVIVTGWERGTLVQGGTPILSHWAHVWELTPEALVSRFDQYLCVQLNPHAG